jgi:hypothetical protein
MIVAATKFLPGRIVATPNALSALTSEDITLALFRHLSGDWGELCREDRSANDHALSQGGRLFSRYHSPGGARFYIITEADSSVTTILLPEDY